MPLLPRLQKLMLEHRFRPSQKLSQNFIVSEQLLDSMVNAAELSEKDTVLEIGAGVGFLTERLLEKSRVVAVEFDEMMCEILEQRFSGNKNFTLIKGDFLSAKLPKFNKIVSLPPYRISSEIMLRLFREDFEFAVIVFQREFVQKLMAEPGFMERSYLSVLTELLFDAKIIQANIPPRAFYPKPESYSALVKFTRNKAHTPKNLGSFIIFLKEVFRYKNKDFPNSLKNAAKAQKKLKIKADSILPYLQKIGVDGEKTNMISTKDFLAVFRKISP
ncbi:MAG: 16S rRNA (adenine(1518)-N(6)/adenine(1519)-N(6))-dimethyltransferase RsmA [archaeon]|nr:16S rRNA (adenine(1518)-N(6)/adenine(1519)-N(6))-dimethyltransferase RsmA [archaeon]